MRVLQVVALCVLVVCSARSQTNYAVSSIPKALLARAGAIVRTSETVIDLKKLDEVYYRYKYAVTILNSSALDEASLFLGYDKTTSIKSVKGTVYNEFGLPVGRISEKNFQDRSAVSDGSLYDDDRIKFYVPAKLSYPFTIEYEYEIKTKQSLYFPSWIPGGNTGVAIERSTMQFVCPESFTLRYKNFNYNGTVVESAEKGIKSYKWQVNNVTALREEPYSPNFEEYLVTVKLAPEAFAYKNIKGSFSNWQEYGKWMNNSLLKDRDEVSDATKQTILNLTKDIVSPKEKAKKIYEFMQNKTRYISVQIGIGGYQPYPAAEVDRLGYGDCKGLVNYTRSLLKVAGIESYYSELYAGKFKRNILPDFTSMQGNHVILCLPFKNDTTWLECTDKFAPFGFLGDFTDDRYALVCTPEGGKIMRTPKLEAKNNKQIRTASFKIDDKGSLSGTMNTVFSGSQYDNHFNLLNESFSEQKKKLAKIYPLANLEINSLEFKQEKGLKPETHETVSLNSFNYCLINKDKLHIRLNGINKMRTLKEVSNRKNPVCIVRGYYDEDVYSYEVPQGYKLDLPPNSKLIENDYGRYSSKIEINGNTIIYKREMLLNEGNYKPEQYEELVAFFQAAADADNIEAVLSKTAL